MHGKELAEPTWEWKKLDGCYGECWAAPFMRGHGRTIGNPLRRVLLSSLKGTAVTKVRIEDVLHEFRSIPGVIEDVTDIVLNMKGLLVDLKVDNAKALYLSATGPGVVTAADIVPDGDARILNPDLHIATLSDEITFRVEVTVDWGRGYVPAEQRSREDLKPGDILVDASFSPVSKVNYRVQNIQYQGSMDYESIAMEIWTNGTMSPDAAFSSARRVLGSYFMDQQDELLDGSSEIQRDAEIAVSKGEVAALEVDARLQETIGKLKLPPRAFNCLRNAKIETVGQLVQKTEAEILDTRSLGRKSLEEIKEKLRLRGLRLGMKVENGKIIEG